MDVSGDQVFPHCNQEIPHATQENMLNRLQIADKVPMEFDEPTNKHAMVQHEDSSKPADKFPLDTAELNESSRSLFSENAFFMTDCSNSDDHEFNLEDRRAAVKRMLQFDSLDDDNGDKNDDPSQGARDETHGSNTNSNKKNSNSKRNEEKAKARKRRIKDSYEVEAHKSPRLNKRRSDKVYLQQLHAESQRLLRETHNAAFKPTPLMQKPISSVLENIRKRKSQLSRNSGRISNNSNSENDEAPDSCTEMYCGDREMKEARMSKTLMKDDVHSIQAKDYDELQLQSNEYGASKMGLDVGSELPFQMHDANDSQFTEQHDSPQEVLAPSRLAMNLKLGSAVDNSHDDGDEDDDDDDDYDDDKENIAPIHGKQSHSSHMGDPVKAFVDDEAEEEEDSDDDPFGSEDSEEDDKGDAEELGDLIETGYVEKPIDNDRRNQLHQQWLEQQDATGTEDLLQRLKCGLEYRDPTLYEDGGEDSLGGDSDDDEEENMVKSDTARLNTLKLKQMIQHPFNEKDDVFLSDDEETEKKLEKQRVLEKIEDASFISPVEDDNSREVFGLIKKLNIVPIVKKKAKSSSIFDTMITGSTTTSSKSSFLGRSSSLSMPSSRKQSSSVVRSFVFGRDDSNSRDAVSASEDSTDMLQPEERPVRHASAKFHSSRSSSMSQKGSMSSESNSTVSLLDVLRRSSVQSTDQSLDGSASLSEDIFLAFKSTRNSVKVNRRL